LNHAQMPGCIRVSPASQAAQVRKLVIAISAAASWVNPCRFRSATIFSGAGGWGALPTAGVPLVEPPQIALGGRALQGFPTYRIRRRSAGRPGVLGRPHGFAGRRQGSDIGHIEDRAHSRTGIRKDRSTARTSMPASRSWMIA
jgi:hypothetical protein